MGARFPRRAVFLDRDGVIIEDVNYLRRPEQIRLVAGAGRAVAALKRAGFKAVLVTNQSGVARGYISRSLLLKVHSEIQRRLGRGRLDGVFFCPHLPREEGGRCRCRKPEIGMIRAARARFRIDLGRSYMIGDTTADLLAAKKAGLRGLLVRTGKGGRDGRYRAKPLKAFKALPQAAAWILRQPA